ncbi:DeoR/GlpR transcriptional regulator [Rhodocytophaga rosea]|uniref:DeoR/GlpR transcriptional regulator n=1 Tax=Rhodocytophaga rosea TaxID=2704465 RepID=A0A6C0GRH1_9BACT|nr:DeoR/GlpR family DNA-binding transcription regulator [Rhodocytophaga rosea]QHT70671.1 DeoR/GlpR transcriptional regulator [Rhodocytophaga rosea]
MLQEERQNVILQQINVHHKVLTTDLCQLMNVSLDTIRRDLSELEKKGRIKKVHGGAISTTFHQPFQQPAVYAKAEKQEIARKALTLLREGMVILTGGGTVMLELARIIPSTFKGTFFTVSPLVALEVAQRSTIDVILLAGRVSRNTYICTGSSVINQLSELRVDLCLVGTNGLSVQEGVTDNDWEVVQVKKAMVKSAEKTALLSISEKLDTAQRMQVCPLTSVHYLLTELDTADEKLKKYTKFFHVL